MVCVTRNISDDTHGACVHSRTSEGGGGGRGLGDGLKFFMHRV